MKIVGRFLTIILLCVMAFYGAATFAADKVESTRVEKVMDFLGEKGQQYVAAMEEITKQYAPDVANAILAVVRINGIQELFQVLGCFFFAGICAFVAKLSYKKCHGNIYSDLCGPMVIFGIMGATVTGVVGIVNAIDVWMWVAIFEPKLRLAKDIISAVVK